MNNTNKNLNLKINISKEVLFFVLLLFNQLPSYSQADLCTKTSFTKNENNFIKIPVNEGATNNDPTFTNVSPFTKLNISSDKSLLSACIFKNNSVRFLKYNSISGNLELTNSLGNTDPVSSNDTGAIRGGCTFSSAGDQFFSLGIGPSITGFDRIYPYQVSASGSIARTMDNLVDDFFIPPDLATSVAITPNSQYLIYLQGNTSNENLSSLQSIQIKPDKSLNKSFIGQAISRLIPAGNYLDLIDSEFSANSKFVYGIYSNLQLGKGGSGDGFGIFKTNQSTGLNSILAEFKKGSNDNPLPELFNKPEFKGFSGFKFIERNTGKFLVISYFEEDTNDLFPEFNYVTKLALFRVDIRSQLSKTASLVQVGLPAITVFKTAPCNSNNFHGISGPVDIVGNIIYLADNNSNESLSKNETYVSSYFVDWENIDSAGANSKVIKPSSEPFRVTTNMLENNTDIAVTRDGKFAFIATSSTRGINNTNIYSFPLQYSSVDCSSIRNFLENVGVCPMDRKAPWLASPMPTITVALNQNKTIKLEDYFQSSDDLSYSLGDNLPVDFISIENNKLKLKPISESSLGKFEDLTIKAKDRFGQTVSAKFSIKVTKTPAETPPQPTSIPTTSNPSSQPVVNSNSPVFNSGGNSGSSFDSGSDSSPDAGSPGTASLPSTNYAPPQPTYNSNPQSDPFTGAPIGRPDGNPSNISNSILQALNASMDLQNKKELSFPTLPKLPMPNRAARPGSEVSINKPSLPDIPNIELRPGDEVGKKIVQSLDIKTLDLSGPDQIIISPQIPYIVIPEKISDVNLEKNSVTCTCSTGKPECSNKGMPVCKGGTVKCIGENSLKIACCKDDQCNENDPSITSLNLGMLNLVKEDPANKKPIQTKEIRGIIKGSEAGLIVFLKNEVMITPKDTENLIYAIIDKDQKVEVLAGLTKIESPNKVFTKVSFPGEISTGESTFVLVLNKGGGKNLVLSKGKIKVFSNKDFENISTKSGQKVKIKEPKVTKIIGRVVTNAEDGGKIVRLVITGVNFASRVISVQDSLFQSRPLTTNTVINFSDNKNIEILRVRVLPKGSKILVTLKVKNNSLNSPLTISTPNGQIYLDNLGVNLFPNVSDSKPVNKQ